ncbi:hypothetical protein [Nocardia sp. NPDC052566]|uniref:hypothetical protein n=1 Tax=Nocardia sp. NPDC052566 TaxID=3364330 RepID=UPI0037CC9429
MMNPSAIGFVRQDISGNGRFRDQAAIHELAQGWGFDLLPVIVVGAAVPAPDLMLLQHVVGYGAAAVIVPSREHIWSARRTITDYCDLIIASDEQTWKRGHQWPPLAFSPYPDGVGRISGRWLR